MKRSNEGKVLLALGAVALVAFLIVAISKTDRGDDKSDTSTVVPTPKVVDPAAKEPVKESPAAKAPQAPAIPTIVVRGGEPVGGVSDLIFEAGDRVRFKVTSDVRDEIHLHGYDISKEVKAGGSVTFDFAADIEGIFELELEERALPIGELQVNP